MPFLLVKSYDTYTRYFAYPVLGVQINYGLGAVIPEDNDDDARHEKFETETERDRQIHSLEVTKIITNS